ncbi:MAG: DEAD/DEAH box helicase [Xanthomonadales bacterium]|nr:DEAD/DEAH box helicase [Xanthomonadales bacterium]
MVSIAPMWTPDFEAQLQLLDRRDRRQGERYLRAGQVRIERQLREPGELRVDAAVQGSRRDPYRLTLRFRAGGSPALESHCSCPLRVDCKHVAAVLLQLREDRQAASTALATASPSEAQRASGVGLQLQVVDQRACLRSLVRIERSNGEVLWRAVSLSYFGGDAPVLPPALLAALHALPSDRDEQGTRLWLRDASAAALLQQLLAGGWCLDDQGQALQAGSEELRQWLWRWAEQGDLRPDLDPGAGQVFWLDGPWCLLPGRLARIDSGLPPALAQQLHELPPLPPEQWQRAWPALADSLPADFPTPPWPSVERIEGQPPQPELLLRIARARDSQLSRNKARRALLGQLRFHYGLASVALGEQLRELRQGVGPDGLAQPPGAMLRPGSRVLRWPRRPKAEQTRIAELLAQGARQDSGGLARLLGLDSTDASQADRHAFLLNPTLDETGLEDFCVRIVPVLRQRGWRIRFDGDFPLRLMDLQLNLQAQVQAEGDGVRVTLRGTLDDETVDLWDALQRAREAGLSAGSRDAALLPLPLADGRRVPIAAAQWRQLDGLLDAAKGQSGALNWQLQPQQLGWLSELQQVLGEAEPDWQAPASLRALAVQLEGEPVCPPVPPPPALQATLRPYQQQGLDWLGFLGQHGLGGILADDMGLGKTLQILAHILAERDAGRLSLPALVVAPKSVLPNWQQEAARFAPSLRTLALEGQTRRRHFRELDQYDLILTTYPLLSRDLALWREQSLGLAVFDESQMLKNPATQAARAARGLPTPRRLALTGTPLENHLGELWAQVDLVAPGLLGSRRDFERRHAVRSGRARDAEALQPLRQRLRPFLLRRSKDQVARDLPPKTVVVRRIALEGSQAERYVDLRDRLSRQLQELIDSGRGLQGQRLRVLEALLRLRQLCCDPRLLPDTEGGDPEPAKGRGRRAAPSTPRSSAKLDHLLTMLEELLSEGRRILIFSQFTSMLALLGEALERQRMPYLLLTGDSSDRETPVRRFQAREVPLFLISLRAGGFGLNLTAADTVIHYDPWWNPAVEAQATDRAHRIGQDKPVFVYRLIARDTVEERIVQLQDRKRELAEALLDDPAGGPGELTAEELLALLQ